MARELAVTAADLSGWRDAFLEPGAAGLKSLARDHRDATIKRLQTKVRALTMDTELLQAKIELLEAGRRPFCGSKIEAMSTPRRRPGPQGPMPDATLVETIRQVREQPASR